MKKATLTTSLLVATCTFVSINSYADRQITRDTPAGVITRTMEQHRTENGYARHHSLSTSDGRSAYRNVNMVRDPEAQSRTREVEGSRLNGNTYSSQSTRQRTEDGYQQMSTFTNAAGQTANREKSLVVDRVSGTATKQTSTTGFNGETQTRTVVVERDNSNSEAL